jgi:hypothetical protein
MGYWGTLIAVRGDETPVALEDLDVSVGSHDGAVRGAGWRVYDAFERDLHAMTGMARAAARRQAREAIAAFGCPPAEAVRHAVNWAAEAGYTVPAWPIGQILRTGRRPGLAARLRLPSTRYVFAEEAYFDLLDRLGLPRAITNNPGSPPSQA